MNPRVAAALLAFVTHCAAAQEFGASFISLGALPGTNSASHARAVNDLGMVVGDSASANALPTRTEAFLWTPATGMIGLGDLPGGTFSSGATAISGNGSFVAGSSFTAAGGRSFLWSPQTGIQQLSPGSSLAPLTANGMSGDGTVVAGFAIEAGVTKAYRWTEATGATALINAPSNATAVSGDGRVVYGGIFAGNQAFRWTAETGLQTLAIPGSVRATSADGSFVAGVMSTGPGQTQAYRWSEQAGLQLLGDLPGGSVFSVPTGISGDGRIIVGYSAGDGPFLNEAFIWDEQNGMRSLQDMLVSAGADLGAFELVEATGISPNGRYVVGSSAIGPVDVGPAWRATLPIPEPQTYAMLLAGLALLAFARKRLQSPGTVAVRRSPA